ncbi:MAG TPA: hypothetical protein VEL76_16105 [Gemmataceae bacterium]|nr:hypothetical protein [Gemmataceae bacterium]
MNGFTMQQMFQQGVQLAQAGWAYEMMGNAMAASKSYQQALQALDTCGSLPGAPPVERFYWMGSCQLRLGWLTYLAGNLPWAQGWFHLAQESLRQACQCDPNNPTYRNLLGQVAGVQDKKFGNAFLGLLKKGLGMLPGLLEKLTRNQDDNTNGRSGSGWWENVLNWGNGGGDWSAGALTSDCGVGDGNGYSY